MGVAGDLSEVTSDHIWMFPIEPSYLTAGGALFGVILTLIVLSVIARLNRRHDRMTKTFETRLNIYADLEGLLDKMPEMQRQAEAGVEATRALRAELEARRAMMADLASAVDAVLGASEDPVERANLGEGAEQKIQKLRGI